MNSGYRAALKRFNAAAAAVRRQSWPAVIQPPAGNPLRVAKLPTTVRREQAEHGTGFIQRARSVFLVPETCAYQPKIGDTITVTECEDSPAEVGTTWRCTDYKAAGAGHEHRLDCFRLD